MKNDLFFAFRQEYYWNLLSNSGDWKFSRLQCLAFKFNLSFYFWKENCLNWSNFRSSSIMGSKCELLFMKITVLRMTFWRIVNDVIESPLFFAVSSMSSSKEQLVKKWTQLFVCDEIPQNGFLHSNFIIICRQMCSHGYKNAQISSHFIAALHVTDITVTLNFRRVTDKSIRN